MDVLVENYIKTQVSVDELHERKEVDPVRGTQVWLRQEGSLLFVESVSSREEGVLVYDGNTGQPKGGWTKTSGPGLGMQVVPFSGTLFGEDFRTGLRPVSTCHPVVVRTGGGSRGTWSSSSEARGSSCTLFCYPSLFCPLDFSFIRTGNRSETFVKQNSF